MKKVLLVGVGIISFAAGLCINRLALPSRHKAINDRNVHEKESFRLSEREGRSFGVKRRESDMPQATDAVSVAGQDGLRPDGENRMAQNKNVGLVPNTSDKKSENGDRASGDDNNGEKKLDQWIAQLSETDAQSREEAFMAIKQYKAEEAVPLLRALLEQTKEQQLKEEIKEAIKFIELPEYPLGTHTQR